jgi:hypothetical protein
MKIFFSLFFFFNFSSLYHKQSLDKGIDFKCRITSKFQTYRVGQIPEMQVNILNNSKDEAYLISSLDGSDVKRRMPYCYFTVEKPKPDTISIMRCGFTNPLRIDDFRLVKPNETFNPYESTDNKGLWADYIITSKETFRTPGIYKIQFHYSTNSSDINKFLGSWDKNPNIPELRKLFEKTPKIDLCSNILEIKIQE